MATVLVGFSDAIAMPETVFSLLNAGHNIKILARKGKVPSLCHYVKNITTVAITAPEENIEKSISDLRAALHPNAGIDVFLALDDKSLWLAKTASEISPLTVRQAHATSRRADIALDKTQQVALAHSCGFDLPHTNILRHLDDIPTDLDLPAIMRPALAVQRAGTELAKGGTQYLMTPTDVAGLKSEASQKFPALLQPLIHGVGQGLFGFASAQGVTCWSAHQRVRMMNPHGSGASACRSMPVDPELKQKASAFLKKAEWRGPFMFEFMKDNNGKSLFVEFNGRLWGSLALARRCGFEYPAWAVEQALNPDFAPADKPANGPHEVRHLGRDLLHLLYVLKGPKTAFHRETWPSFSSSLRSVLQIKSGASYYNHDSRHPKFFLKDAADTVIRQVRNYTG
jgi:predicted ATP-grasp superfamily ATP-dependent carboligase